MKAIDDAIDKIEAAGFERVPLSGMRERWTWNGWFATVGPQTLHFWLPIPGVRIALQVQAEFRLDTRDAAAIDAFLAALPAFDDNAESGDNDSESWRFQ